MIRDGRFRAAAVFTLLLFVIAFLIGWDEYRQGVRNRVQAAQTVREQWVKQGEKHPHLGAHLGLFVFKDELPLAALDPGLKPYVGSFLPLETHDRSHFRDRPADDSSPALRFGQLTAAVVMQTLLPLLLIFLSFSTITAEREGGTLAQLLASGVSRRKLAAGKLLGIGVALLLLMVPAAALGGATLWLSAGGGQRIRFGLMCVSWLGYFLIFALLGIAVSAKARTSQGALVLLLVFWIGNGLLLPRLAASIGERLAPTPSTEEFHAAINHSLDVGLDGKDDAGEHFKNLIAKTLQQYGVSRIEDLPVGYAGVMLKESDARFERIYEHHFGALYATWQRQRRLQHLASFIGPLIAMREVSRGLTGMDIAHYDHFAQAAEKYRRGFVERTNDAAEKLAHGTGWELQVGREFWESVPPFQYNLPDWKWTVRQNLLSFAVLLVWLIGAALLAFFSVSRTQAV